MTIQSECAPLDLFPSEDDLGGVVANATTGQTPTAVAFRHTVGPPGVAPASFHYGERDRLSFDEDPIADAPRAPRVLHRRRLTTAARMPDRGQAAVIFTTAALVACLVVGIVWVTIEPIATNRASSPDEARTVEPFS